jgi:serine/threonine protein kinase
VPLVLPRPDIRADHELSGASSLSGGGGGGGGAGEAGGGGNAAAATAPAPAPPAATAFGPLDTTDPTLTTDAVVPPSDVLRDGDFHALYLLGEELGRGSYGVVRRCERRSDGRVLAVKVLSLVGPRGEHRLPEVEDEVRIWRRVQEAHDEAAQLEAQAAAAAAEAAAAGAAAADSDRGRPSPNPQQHHHCPVVRLVSAHRDLTAAYLVQELCEGGDLQAVLDLQAAETVELAGLEARAAAGDVTAAAVLSAAAAGGEEEEGGSGGNGVAASSPRPGGFPGALPEPLAAAAMASALRFIATCHDAGVVFGDVKPSNFLLREPAEEEEREEGDEAAAAAPAGAAAAPPLARRRRRQAARLLRLQGVDFGTALALPTDGVCSIHPGYGQANGSCACAEAVDAGGSTGGAAAVAAALAAGNNNTIPAGSSPPPPAPSPQVYASECTPRRGLSGTPVYMAPELVRDRRAGPAADCWALGAMAYQLLTGRFPFWPDVDVADLARLPTGRVLAEVAAAPLALEHPRATAHLTPEARGFLARLLERDPRRRATARQALSHPFLRAHNVGSAADGGGAGAAPFVTSR